MWRSRICVGDRSCSKGYHITDMVLYSSSNKRRNLFLLLGVKDGVLHVSRPEEDGPQLRPDLGIPPMLAEDISGVQGSCDVVVLDNTRSDGLLDSVIRKHNVSLVQSRVWDSAAVHNRAVVTKHVGTALYRNSEVSESCPTVHGSLGGSAAGYEFGPVG